MTRLDPVGLQTALESFLLSADFKAGIFSNTRAKRQKTSYVVELMPEGRYRVLWEGQVGDKNDSPSHLFLNLPLLEDKDLTLWRGSEESYFNHDFATKQPDLVNQLRDTFSKCWK